MNANTSVGLGYSELIDSHRARLQIEKGFLTESPWAQHGGCQLPPFPLRPSATPPCSFTLWAPNVELMGVDSQQRSWMGKSPKRLFEEGRGYTER